MAALPVPRELQLYAKDRSASASAGTCIDQVIAMPEIGTAFLDHMAKENKTDNTFTVDHHFGESATCVGQDGQMLVVIGIRLVFEVVRQRTAVPLEHGSMLDAKIAFGEGDSDTAGVVRVAIVEQEGKKAVLDVRKQDGSIWRSMIHADANAPTIGQATEKTS